MPQINGNLETAITRMTGLLLIELLAFNTFKWAAELVGDPDVCAYSEQAAALVGYIRSEEGPRRLPQNHAILAGFHDLETPDLVIEQRADSRSSAASYG